MATLFPIPKNTKRPNANGLFFTNKGDTAKKVYGNPNATKSPATGILDDPAMMNPLQGNNLLRPPQQPFNPLTIAPNSQGTLQPPQMENAFQRPEKGFYNQRMGNQKWRDFGGVLGRFQDINRPQPSAQEMAIISKRIGRTPPGKSLFANVLEQRQGSLVGPTLPDREKIGMPMTPGQPNAPAQPGRPPQILPDREAMLMPRTPGQPETTPATPTTPRLGVLPERGGYAPPSITRPGDLNNAVQANTQDVLTGQSTADWEGEINKYLDEAKTGADIDTEAYITAMTMADDKRRKQEAMRRLAASGAGYGSGVIERAMQEEDRITAQNAAIMRLELKKQEKEKNFELAKMGVEMKFKTGDKLQTQDYDRLMQADKQTFERELKNLDLASAEKMAKERLDYDKWKEGFTGEGSVPFSQLNEQAKLKLYNDELKLKQWMEGYTEENGYKGKPYSQLNEEEKLQLEKDKLSYQKQYDTMKINFESSWNTLKQEMLNDADIGQVKVLDGVQYNADGSVTPIWQKDANGNVVYKTNLDRMRVENDLESAYQQASGYADGASKAQIGNGIKGAMAGGGTGATIGAQIGGAVGGVPGVVVGAVAGAVIGFVGGLFS